MPKKITIRMNSNSIGEAIKELKKYHNDFMIKLDMFVRMLANDGIQVAMLQARSSVGDSKTPDFSINVNNSGDIVSATINMQGEDVLFIEFGAGISYNPSGGSPHASDYGMGVGTYPGQTHAFERGWWYVDDSGNKHYSRGTQGTAPMYHAKETIRNQAILSALQIFRS